MSRIYGYSELQHVVPERRPLLMVDRLELDVNARRGVGVKNLSTNEEFFQGHFPGAPIMPGVLQVAAMAQVAGALLKETAGAADARVPWCKSVSRIKFRSPVRPGDRLVVSVTLGAEAEGGGVNVDAEARVGDAVACHGHLVISLEDMTSLCPLPVEMAPPLFVPTGTENMTPLRVGEVMKAIPHRYPFLLLDGVRFIDAAALHVVAVKNVTGNEPFFAGSSVPAVPGWLLVESAAQTGCVLAMAMPDNHGKLGLFMSIDQARFLAPVVPGDQVIIDLNATGRGRFGKAEGFLYVGSRVVTEFAIKFAIMDRNESGLGL